MRAQDGPPPRLTAAPLLGARALYLDCVRAPLSPRNLRPDKAGVVSKITPRPATSDKRRIARSPDHEARIGLASARPAPSKARTDCNPGVRTWLFKSRAPRRRWSSPPFRALRSKYRLSRSARGRLAAGCGVELTKPNRFPRSA